MTISIFFYNIMSVNVLAVKIDKDIKTSYTGLHATTTAYKIIKYTTFLHVLYVLRLRINGDKLGIIHIYLRILSRAGIVFINFNAITLELHNDKT